MMYGVKKSDPAIVARKPTNNAGIVPAAESVERRAGAEGNVNQQSTYRTLIRARVSQALGRVRRAARVRKKEQFTALLHHVNIDLLRLSFYAIKRKAAPGADGVTWEDYEADLESNLHDLHARVHRGAYRAQPSRRTYIRRRPGGVVAVARIQRRQVDLVLKQVMDRVLERARQQLPFQVHRKKPWTRIDRLVAGHRACLIAANDDCDVAVAKAKRQDARMVFLQPR